MKLNNVKRGSAYVMAVMLFLSTTITACGAKNSGTSPVTNSASSNPDTMNNAWNSVETKGFVSSSIFGNMQIIQIDRATQTLQIQVPLPGNPVGLGFTEPVPEVPGAVATVTQDPATMKWYFTFSVPLTDLVKGIQFLGNSTLLPNGDPLPQVPSGELPKIATHIEQGKLNLYVYGSVKFFAVFVPTPKINPYIAITAPIKNADKTKILGYVSTVPAKTNYDGGVYFAMVFPPELQRLLDNLVH